jgi:UDP-N-acetylglucosamine 2-epimerase (non-hydrolysing)
MEAGNRCFDQRVPEEINRKIVDHISDINLPYTEHARRYLLAEGIRPETVIKTGSPMMEVLSYYQPEILASDILERLDLIHRKYFVASIHREETTDSPTDFMDIMKSLNLIAQKYDLPVIVSAHPRMCKNLEEMGGSFKLNPKIKLLKPLGLFDYVHLQMHSFCVLSDSGTITEESSILNFAAVTVRKVHERPEGMDEASVIMCGLKGERILDALKVATEQFNEEKRIFDIVRDYQVNNVSKKVTRIIISYVDYVNRNIWHKCE